MVITAAYELDDEGAEIRHLGCLLLIYLHIPLQIFAVWNLLQTFISGLNIGHSGLVVGVMRGEIPEHGIVELHNGRG